MKGSGREGREENFIQEEAREGIGLKNKPFGVVSDS
jgi:hypothetical protein